MAKFPVQQSMWFQRTYRIKNNELLKRQLHNNDLTNCWAPKEFSEIIVEYGPGKFGSFFKR